MIFEEHRVAVTPMQTGYRLGSMMEFVGYDESISPKRIGYLKEAADSTCTSRSARRSRRSGSAGGR